ncbi:hypothetical protein F5883DRAFT_440117 [Diaporthe sp. PMI_573]|nr:hypothetical protein F5883DRAFT_440117 [Diaporthaceae sp. PMI_573]
MAQSYSRMVLESNEVGLRYNVAAAAASWFMLAGFFILPGTFTSIKRSTFLSSSEDGRRVQSAVQNVPLLPVAGLCYVVAVGGLCTLWRRFRANYIWVTQHILLPSCFNCLSGLFTVLTNVYTARKGIWSPTAWATLGIVLFAMLVSLSGALFYQWTLSHLR